MSLDQFIDRNPPQPEDEIGLALSGGGYRAMVFHVDAIFGKIKNEDDRREAMNLARMFLLVFHRTLPDLQRMKLCYSAAASSAPRSVFSWCD